MQSGERRHRDVYANRVNAHVSTFDFAFDFELTDPSLESETLHSELVARIRVSPQLAKAFARLLDQLVEQYEDEAGEIELPETGGLMPWQPYLRTYPLGVNAPASNLRA